ncbi:amidohydrolase [Antarcticimicrobium luteum]|uniref:Amidohydrolase n=1 Tax=Antarcticimicrobium luteum TaxID=2547397 RepID=A0A4R5V972_9RHOB|nr:amidohydrolase [Antarcticimicrobium luteum]TDK48673.1 amidohydrolase [Antarcticimicrobium luteum]
MFLTNEDMIELVAWRRKLHAMPELSGEEAETAREVRRALSATGPDRLIGDLGGHGLAAVYEGAEPGPTVMFRAELDGLAIEEVSDLPYRSQVPGRGHQCGHDGHMATLMALARGLSRKRPRRGRAVLMFQPAEENGAGAAAVVADPAFAAIKPDYAFAYHNMPGMPLGHVAVAEGPITCASRGMRIILTGRTAHASMPETGVSPVPAVLKLLPALGTLNGGMLPSPDFAMTTITHVGIGEPAFGISPGNGAVWLTLRSLTDSRMEALCLDAERLAAEVAAETGLGVEIEYDNVFADCSNDPEAVAYVRRALEAEAIPFDTGDLPLRGSEDFGGFGKDGSRIALFLLGSGENRPHLHNPDYDFPDDLIGIGARVFNRTLRDILG